MGGKEGRGVEEGGCTQLQLGAHEVGQGVWFG